MPFIMGLLTGLVFWATYLFMQRKQAVVRWFHWLVAIAGWVLILAACEIAAGSVAEREPRAVTLSLVLLAFPGLILLVLFWRYTLGDRGKRVTPAK